MDKQEFLWLRKTDDQKIETIREYFLKPKILLIENLIKLTKKNIKQCGEKIGYLQEICDQEEIVVTKTKIKEIKAKIEEIQRKIKNVKAKRGYKDKKLKRLLAAEWSEKEEYLTDMEVMNYIRYGGKRKINEL